MEDPGCGRNLIITKYKELCFENNISFTINNDIKSYNESTLFCPAGMQQFKSKFNDLNLIETIANVQSCLRLNDLDEIGDGTHLLYFEMIGFFSFRQKTVKETISFMFEFLNRLGIKPDYVTIHPDNIYWKEYYKDHDVEIRLDNECIWTDGEIGGYCTEFYKNDIEIGNIVNTLGTCIDVGFGLERLEMILTGKTKSKEEVLKDTIIKMVESGFIPSNVKQGYVLRKLLRLCHKLGIIIEHKFYIDEKIRQEKIIKNYESLKDKFKNKPKEWWYDTHGINLDEMN